MEHGVFGHNTSAYEEMVRVPLAIIGPPGYGFARGAYSGAVDLVDLMPTFGELFGLKSQAPYAGESLMGVLRGGTDHGRTFSISRSAIDHFRVAYRIGDLKLIAKVDPEYREIESYELYDLGEDPGEQRDLAAEESLAAPLLDGLRDHLAHLEHKDSSGDPVLSAEDAEQIRALGYGKSE